MALKVPDRSIAKSIALHALRKNKSQKSEIKYGQWVVIGMKEGGYRVGFEISLQGASDPESGRRRTSDYRPLRPVGSMGWSSTEVCMAWGGDKSGKQRGTLRALVTRGFWAPATRGRAKGQAARGVRVSARRRRELITT